MRRRLPWAFGRVNMPALHENGGALVSTDGRELGRHAEDDSLAS
jgi:hypothetical protein